MAILICSRNLLGKRSSLLSNVLRSSRDFSAEPIQDVAGASSGEYPAGMFNIQGDALPGRSAYLDSQATTPIDPRVLDTMLPHMIGLYGNPHSRTHMYGWESDKAVEDARAKVASLIGASAKEVLFTSGATESNNISVKGVGRFYKKRKNHVITTQIEHKCVLDSCRALQQEGFEVTYLPVQKNGLIDLGELEDAMRPETSLVSVMAINNEIGVLQPLKEIGAMCRARKIFFHTDAAQMIGKVPIDVNEMNIDLMSISGHKVYGPKGIGALYVRRRPRVRLEPIFSGGGQERGIRSGTLAHSLCIGLGAACELAGQEIENDDEWVRYLSKKLCDGIEAIPDTVRNGDAPAESRYPGCVNYSFAFVEGESLLMALKNIAVSSGSACTSESLEPSYVLRAIGVGEDLAHTSIRFGIGRFTTEAEIDFVIDQLQNHNTASGKCPRCGSSIKKVSTSQPYSGAIEKLQRQGGGGARGQKGGANALELEQARRHEGLPSLY
eukprot:CAMPEP_0185768168 /NCGR_PEP_ID=MMETSP1174-20130828/48006_1 /TAXON_ID=35687 /ORGANISM="Dictyocha speculum, Strain CCMP1381" /LENGTH=495 /DNA_ID=CAMNT_0028452743 /DNA_START=18 /DNA_END=1506 /DNA_ORIENTATION=+